ncbi:MAG: energy-coupling factor ABC transporter ATP-binding protein [Clostridia bacterium]|nr:energy-coupling factor ABC transporter ATP-binding protein [Clostridia bacterium]
MNLIELNEITFRYNEDEAPVLKDYSMSVQEGSCVIIEGDNGAGKTTLFRILTGLSFPEKGDYSFDGVKITKGYLKDNAKAKKFHKRIGFLFQSPDVMLFNPRVYDEVAFGPRQMGLSDQEVEERVGDCLKLFDLEDLTDKAPYHLSGGQKKRVALASVISLNPDVLILDEPYAGLDKKTQEWLTQFLREWKAAGKTLLIATHSSELLSGIADEIVQIVPAD